MGKPVSKLFATRMEIPALETTTSRAEGGDAQAQFSLGLQFANDGKAQDYTQAAQWYLKAASQDHALAQFNLAANIYLNKGMDAAKAALMVLDPHKGH